MSDTPGGGASGATEGRPNVRRAPPTSIVLGPTSR
jgi:hypothetical protein